MHDQLGLFTLQEIGFGPFEVEAGGRFEHTSIRSAPLGLERNFSAFSGAVGIGYILADNFRAGVNVSRAQRAPSGEELFANGPHIATQAFEIGDPNLRMERAWGVEGYLRGRLGPAELSLAIYRNWFEDYIYLRDTGRESDGLPVFAFLQAGADHFGIEGEVSVPLVRRDGFALLADLRGDYIRAELDDGTPLPRILHCACSPRWKRNRAFDARVEAQWFAAQDHVARSKRRPRTLLINASLAWKPVRGNDSVTLLAQDDNIFDVEGRRHASLTKDFVPLPGRNFKLSAVQLLGQRIAIGAVPYRAAPVKNRGVRGKPAHIGRPPPCDYARARRRALRTARR